MNQEIIGLGGEKYSGKNTAAKIMVEKYGFKEVSLALPLKTLVSKVFEIPMSVMEDPILKETPLEKPVTINMNNVYEIIRLCYNLIDLAKFKKTEETVLKYMVKRITKETKIIQTLQGNIQQKEFKTFETPRKLLQFVGTDLIRDCISPYFWCKVLDEQIKNDSKVIITDVRFFEEREYVKVKAGTLIKIEREKTEVKKDGHASENSLGGNGEYNFIIRNNSTVEDLTHRLETLYNYNKMLKEDKIYVLAKEK